VERIPLIKAEQTQNSDPMNLWRSSGLQRWQ